MPDEKRIKFTISVSKKYQEDYEYVQSQKNASAYIWELVKKDRLAIEAIEAEKSNKMDEVLAGIEKIIGKIDGLGTVQFNMPEQLDLSSMATYEQAMAMDEFV